MYSYKAGIRRGACHCGTGLFDGRTPIHVAEPLGVGQVQFHRPHKTFVQNTQRVSAMVKSTIIVRASDALPLAASVDDEEVSFVLCHILRLRTRHSTSIRPRGHSRSTSNKPS